ncbi:AAA family ATPase [Puia sp. P3]|uniref:AAA family ATPase n=1 Tax=Puia sp. P3 TaxID=3423952 RepID=UPI003D668EB4
MTTDPHNPVFELAARFVNQTARHVFLTGRAGTGKTTFLKYIRDTSFKKMAVVAPTGVAAINAGGTTMHSFFQLPFGPFIPTPQYGWNPETPGYSDPNTLFRNIRFNANRRQLLQELELLIIDEISMVRADTLDAVDTILRHFRQQPDQPFGGLQVLFIGDLFQLPPVVPKEEWQLLQHHYTSPSSSTRKSSDRRHPYTSSSQGSTGRTRPSSSAFSTTSATTVCNPKTWKDSTTSTSRNSSLPAMTII